MLRWLFILFFLSALPTSNSAQTATPLPEPAKPLELGIAIPREIAAGGKHFYQIEVLKNQFFGMEIRNHGPILGLEVELPDGRKESVYDLLGVRNERLSVSRVAAVPGRYVFRIYTSTKAKPGNYEIELTELRTATDRDIELQRAHDLFFEHIRLNREGKVLESRPPLLESIEILTRLAGPDDRRLHPRIGRLADSYVRTGDYVQAEDLYLKALLLIKKIFGDEHSQTANAHRQLGMLFYEKGDFQKAAESFLEAVRIYDGVGQGESLIAGDTMLYLGESYAALNQNEKSLTYNRRSLEINEKLVGPDSFHNSYNLQGVGRSALALGDYGTAESMFARSLGLAEKEFGENSYQVIRGLNPLGELFTTTGDYGKADVHYQRALSINVKTSGLITRDSVETLLGLARLYVAQGKIDEATSLESQGAEIEERIINANIDSGSEREKLALLNDISTYQSYRHISLHTQLARENKTARDLAVTTILRRKGLIQDALSGRLGILRQRAEPSEKKTIEALTEVNAQLSNLMLNAPPKGDTSDRKEKVSVLEKRREQLESELSRLDVGFFRSRTPVTVDAVSRAIPIDAALVEYYRYQPYDARKPYNKSAFGPPRYVAYVLRNGSEPQWKDIGTAADVDASINAWRESLGNVTRRDERQLSRSVYALLIQPLRSFFGTARHILVSPDGELSLIPFAAIADDTNTSLIEKYKFTYLTSGRDLLANLSQRKDGTPPVIFSNPAFGGQEAAITKTNSNRRSVTASRSVSETYFAPLDATKDEALGIQQVFPEARVFSGTEATEANLKTAENPKILHIATHGFFLENSTRKVEIENPLLRSGIALAGANRRGKLASGDDGILTALEASGLNLWGTKLVVLSACDTGLGEVKNGEGVYGLRRAFMLAGTESLVMSLWSVSDYTTRDLMTRFYKNLKAGKGRGESLHLAQLDILKQKGRQHPFYWAAFIHTGEWANLDGKR